MDTPKLNHWLLAIRDAAKHEIQKPPPGFLRIEQCREQMRLGHVQTRKILYAAVKAGSARVILLYRRTPSGHVRRVPFYGPPVPTSKSR